MNTATKKEWVIIWGLGLGISLFQHPIAPGISIGMLATSISLYLITLNFFLDTKGWILSKNIIVFEVLCLFFIIYAFFSGISTANPNFYNRLIANIAGPILPLISYVIIRKSANSETLLKIITFFFFLGGLVTLINGILLNFEGRATGIAGGKNFTALTLAPAAVIFAHYLTSDKKNLHKIISLFGITAITFAVVLTGSRSGLAALLLGVTGYFALNHFKALVLTFIPLFIATIFTLTALKTEPTGAVFKRFSDAIETVSNLDLRIDDSTYSSEEAKKQSSTILQRYMYLSNGIEIFKENPIFGIGFGHPREDITLSNGRIAAYGPHNAYLFLLAETGILGFAIFMLVIIALLVTIKKVRQYESNHNFKSAGPNKSSFLFWGLITILTGGLAAGIFDALIFWLWASIIFSTLAHWENYTFFLNKPLDFYHETKLIRQ